MENKNFNTGNLNSEGGNIRIGDEQNIYNITNFFEGLTLLIQEYKEQIKTIEDFLYSFKPKTALSLVTALESRILESDINDKNIVRSKILFLKGLCKSELENYPKNETALEFTKAYSLNKTDLKIRNRVVVEYLNIEEFDKAKKLADEIIESEEFNINAWFVKVMASGNIKESLKTVPKTVFNNYSFQLTMIYQIMRIEKDRYFEKLSDYGLKFYIDFEKYNQLTYDNKGAWIVAIDLLTNQLLNKNPLMYIAGEKFLVEETSEMSSLLKLLKIYTDKLEESEISNSLYHQKFIFNYFKYLTTNDDEFAIEIESINNSIEKPSWFYTMVTCQILNHKGKYNKSLDLLEKFHKESPLLNYEFFLFKSIMLHLTDQDDKIDGLFDEYINSIEVIDNKHFFNIYNAFFDTQKRVSNIQSIKAELDKILESSFSFDELKELFKLTTEIRYIEEYEVSEAFKSLLNLSACNKFDVYFKNLIVDNLGRIGKRLEAINFIESYVDKTEISETLRLYIILLHEQLYDKNDNERGKYKELMTLLEFWRKNNTYIDESLLKYEHNLYNEINNLDKLEEIDTILYNAFPENEHYLLLYLNTLERKHNHELIKNISQRIKENFTNEKIGVNISAILLRNNLNTSKGFQILYNLAINSNHTFARRNYFSNSILLEDFFKRYEVVEIDNWVQYEVDGLIEKVKIQKGNKFHTKFIGKNVGDLITHTSSMTKKIKTITILEIFDDALHLYKEIMDEIKNPVNELGFESINFSHNIEDFEKNLIENFGFTGSEEESQKEERLNDYYNYRIGFSEVTAFVFRSDFISAYLALTNSNEHKFTTLPNKATKDIDLTNDDKFVLDFSTFQLFYFLEKEFGFVYKHKFVISFFLKVQIEKDLNEEKHSPSSPMTLQITMNGIKKHLVPENYKEKRIEFLESLLSWINIHCIVDYVEEKLDSMPKLSRKKNIKENQGFMPMVDYMHLSIRDNGFRLISSDSTTFLFVVKSGFIHNILNPEKYLNTFYPEKCNQEFYRYLLKSNYIGISVNLETIKTEFFDFIAGKENYYSVVLQNLQFSINDDPNIILTVTEFLKYLYLINSITIEDKNRYAIEIFNYVFNGMSVQLAIEFEKNIRKEFKLLGDLYDEVLKQFEISIRNYNT